MPGHVVTRGPRHRTKYYLKYVDTDGRWKMRLAEGAVNKAEATTQLNAILKRVVEGRVGIEPRKVGVRCGPLMDDWIKTLENRNARNDRNRYNLHLRPRWENVPIAEVNVGAVLQWLEEQKAAGRLASGSQRHNLTLLSRFFGWAIEHGHATVNPVLMVPAKRWPKTGKRGTDSPWLDSDDVVVALMEKMPEPVNLIFYIGNRSGLRTGEICGLRMSDLDFLADGAIRVRYSFNGPLKEDREGEGKVKWAPAPEDALEFLGMWLKRRKLQGAQQEDLVFPAPPSNRPRKGTWTGFRREYIGSCWDAARDKVNAVAIGAGANKPPIPETMDFYSATRHSFTSRNLKQGATLDEVADALGHSTPQVTQAHYNHYVRKTFSSVLTKRLGSKGNGTE